MKYSGDSGIHRRDLLRIGRVAAAGGGLVALAAATAGPAAATVTPPPTIEAPAPVPADGATSEPVLSVTKSTLGLSDVDNTSDLQKPVSLAQQAALDLKADESGIVRGSDGKRYRMVACALRNSGTGFQIINDDHHMPVEVASIATSFDGMSATLNLSFEGLRVGSVIAAPDETLAAAGYQFGASVGLNSVTIFASQPGGFGDYVSWNGAVWVSLNGLIQSTSMNASTGLITCTHAAVSSPYGGSVTSRSLTKRASMEGISATSTSLFLVDNLGVAVKTPTKDSRFWITRTGARRVPMSELAKANANIWVYGMFEV
jgi:hypothetical protein